MLTNKYYKTGVIERTLLRPRFVKACMHGSYLMRKVLLCCMYAKNGSNKSYLFKETTWLVKLLQI